MESERAKFGGIITLSPPRFGELESGVEAGSLALDGADNGCRDDIPEVNGRPEELEEAALMASGVTSQLML